MTILYCIFSLADPGGMQRALTVKANYLADAAGHSVHIVTRDAAEPHFRLSDRVVLHAMTGEGYRKRLTWLLNTLCPAISISLYGEESKFLYKINDGSKKILEFHFTRNHLVHLVRGLPHIRFRSLRLQYVRLLQFMAERVARHYDKLVLLTEADRCLWGNPANAVVIPNPLSFTSMAKSDLGVKRILSAGRLIATKGFDLLIRAFGLVAPGHRDWTLTIIGEGQDKDFLLDLIRQQDLAGQVSIIGPVTDIVPELLRSSIYAMASRYEGFGLVITEAMECGVPTVAFDCECGPGSIIRHGVDGLLVPVADITGYAAALERLMGSQAFRETMGRAAADAAGRFSACAVMPHWQKLFHSPDQYNQPVNA